MSAPVQQPENTYDKAVGARLDYGFNWGLWLPDGDTVDTSDWDVPAGLTSDGDGIVVGGLQTFVWIAGGTEGRTYQVTNTITTTEGRIDVRTLFIRVKPR